MKAEFESGAWVELRDPKELNAKDKSAMLSASYLNIDWVGQTSTPVSVEAMRAQLYAVMARVITAWSYDYMLPKDDPSEDEDGHKTYDASLMVLPIDDFNELEDAVQPHVDKLQSGPKGARKSSPSSNGSSKARAAGSRRA